MFFAPIYYIVFIVNKQVPADLSSIAAGWREVSTMVIVYGVLYCVVFIIVMAVFLLIMARVRSAMDRRRSRREIEHYYQVDKTLLRGHDYVASIWKDFIQGKKNVDPVLVANVVAAATEVEIDAQKGFYFHGRPIEQGWMTKRDFQDYYAFLQQYGNANDRYRAFFGLLHAPRACLKEISNPNLRKLVDAFRSTI